MAALTATVAAVEVQGVMAERPAELKGVMAAAEAQVVRWEALEDSCRVAQPEAAMVGALQVVRGASAGPVEMRAGSVAWVAA